METEDGFVTHGAHTADLQPLKQAPEKTNKDKWLKKTLHGKSIFNFLSFKVFVLVSYLNIGQNYDHLSMILYL